MRSFVGELKRRNVFRVAIAYGAVSWLLLQACGLIFDAFELPHVAMRVVFVLLVVGFLPALVIAWIYELTPDGLKRESEVDPAASMTHQTGRRLGIVIVGVLAAAVCLLLLDRFAMTPRAVTPAVDVTAKLADHAQSVPASIAVLPFTDMSQSGDQGYFSDGMSEELLNLLTQVPGLHVAGRTSSFSFKGKSATIAEIGKALNVAMVLEGSVRKSGDQLRITAQLVSVADGYHLWSKDYNRKLTDVFAVQDDIAGAVVDALKLKLLPAQRPSTAKHHVPSFETYDNYLLGVQLLIRNNAAGFRRAVDAFRRAVALDPEYAAAYAGMAMAESFVAEDGADDAANALGRHRANAAAEHAVELDPALGDAYAARGYLRATDDWNWDGALADLTKALALDPGDARNQLRYGYLLATLGRLPEARIALDKSVELDPLFTPGWWWLGRIKAAQTDYDGARLALQRVLAIDPEHESASNYLGIVSLLQGNPAAALQLFAKSGGPFAFALVEHDLDHPVQSQHALDQLIAHRSKTSAYAIAVAYAWRGDCDAAFTWLDRAIAQHDAGLLLLKYDPLLRSLRSDTRYAGVLRKMGLPE